MNKLLVIVGVSGSGKSYLEQNLIKDYSDIFHKWQQVTTRLPREGEMTKAPTPYIFLQESTYDFLKDRLVGRVGLMDDSYGSRYGSIPDFKKDTISTVILSTEGLLDIKHQINTGKVKVDSLFVLGLDVSYSDLLDDAKRENRNEEFVEIEREVLKHADYIHTTSTGKYLNPNEVMNVLFTHGFLTK